ncbi:substrate-binding domain-containing protein [Tateyamaria sp. syn59]|uniref:substrate-binding domain-containing protein n=1 Tax=Tateyamaria sp. syn59 TaxID=2576942 RepID=UPI0016757B80|nr:substrate-binding domain-containing protein [Tateyamaria sp. syn59]
MNFLTKRVGTVTAFVLGAAIAANAEALDWPNYGEDREFMRVDGGIERSDGFTNALPDVVGPVDGSASLTIFTEGNHYPVLLPLVLDEFVAWCQTEERCAVSREDILVVTLPQVMIMQGFASGGFRFGNAQLPVAPDTPVYPDLVMLGSGPMARLAGQNLLAEPPRTFARHLGMGMLVSREAAAAVSDLEAFAGSELPFVMATPRETGARMQYVETLSALLGTETANTVLARETGDFPGRLAIQHRDIPYAVMNDIAPVGLLFGHLSRFYAEHWPEDLVFVEVPEAASFGREIAVAPTRRNDGADPELVGAFLDFLLDAAPDAYLEGGFADASTFGFGEEMSLASD